MRWLPLALIGCGGSYDGPPPEDTAVFGRVVGILGSGVGDVTICGHELDLPCVQSENDGDFLLEPMPGDTDVIITMEKDGFLRTAYHHHTSVAEEWRKVLMSDFVINTMTNRADTEQVPGKGHAMFILWQGPSYDDFDRVEGMTFSVSGPSQGEIFYQGGDNFPDLDLTETSTSGAGGAFNLDPGEYELTFTGDVTCEPWFSHDFSPGDPVPMTVFPDMGSYVDLVCR